VGEAVSILLVEDDRGLRDAYRLVLGALGLEVEGAATGEEALAGVTARAPDAIVVDLGLPDLGGPALIRRLRGAAPDAALVVLTGQEGDELRRGCREAGADAFLVKPVTGRELRSALDPLLGRPRPGPRGEAGGEGPGEGRGDGEPDA